MNQGASLPTVLLAALIPEPGWLALLVAGGAMLGRRRRLLRNS